MRLFKEVTGLVLTAMLGMFAGAYCTDIFGANVTGELLKYGGLVCSGFLVVSQRLGSASAAIESLDEFDSTTRDGYVAALSDFKGRFRRRFVVGLFFSAVAAAFGVILAEWETKDVDGQAFLSVVGFSLLTTSAVMVGAQLLASSWPAEFLASTAAIARADKKRVEKLSRYASGEEFPKLPQT